MVLLYLFIHSLDLEEKTDIVKDKKTSPFETQFHSNTLVMVRKYIT